MNPADKQLLYPRSAPITAEDVPVKWLHQVRAIILRDSHKLRAGFPACIDVQGRNGWHALQLPSNGVEFVGKRDRDTVLAWLNGDKPLPEIPAP